MSTPSMHDYVLERLQSVKGHWPETAWRVGVPYSALKKIASRMIQNPGIGHLQKIHDYFRAQEKPRS